MRALKKHGKRVILAGFRLVQCVLRVYAVPVFGAHRQFSARNGNFKGGTKNKKETLERVFLKFKLAATK